MELYDKYNVRESGFYYIFLDNRIVVCVFCNMIIEGGWMVNFFNIYVFLLIII